MNAADNPRTALLCIDLQRLGCSRDYVSLEHHGAVESPDDAVERFLEAIDGTVLPNIALLQEQFRATGHEIIHTRIQSLTADGRDRSLEHKRLGIHAAPGSDAAEFVPSVAPTGDEIVLNKTASGVFVSTNLEYVLRNLSIRNLVVCGVYTNECVSSAVRSAADLGFRVRVVADATAAITPELHKATLLIIDGRYGDVVDTATLLQSLN
jgi:nicotinamidase-related amidase